MPEPAKRIPGSTDSAFERWAEAHPHRAHALAGLLIAAITALTIALLRAPAGTVALAGAGLGAATVLMLEYFLLVTGHSMLGSGPDPRGPGGGV